MMYMHEVFAFHLKSSPFWSRIAGMHEFCKFPRQEGRVALQHAAPVACGLVGTAHTGSSTLPLPPRQLDCRCGHALVPARRPLRSQLIDGLPRESAWPRSSASAQLKVLHENCMVLVLIVLTIIIVGSHHRVQHVWLLAVSSVPVLQPVHTWKVVKAPPGTFSGLATLMDGSSGEPPACVFACKTCFLRRRPNFLPLRGLTRWRLVAQETLWHGMRACKNPRKIPRCRTEAADRAGPENPGAMGTRLTCIETVP